MALVGAITRLTESGLSITDWAPLTGVVPPSSPEEWQKAFAAYQKIPQYQIMNPNMTLESFKGIYFWEWFHRLWGRLIGVVFLAPLLLFLKQKQISRATGSKLLFIFLLGGLQGFVGWYMVQSGLETRTSVSPYRLAMHLGFALTIYSILLWIAFDGLKSSEIFRPKIPRRLVLHGWISLLFLATTMVWGAFVAGLHAGLAYNTWPLMEGEIVPTGAFTLTPFWHNFFENTALVQFIHRWLGPTTMLVLLTWIWRCWRAVPEAHKLGLVALGLVAILQVALGISTLLSGVRLELAVAHQGNAILLLSLVLFNLQRLCGNSTAHK